MEDGSVTVVIGALDAMIKQHENHVKKIDDSMQLQDLQKADPLWITRIVLHVLHLWQQATRSRMCEGGNNLLCGLLALLVLSLFAVAQQVKPQTHPHCPPQKNPDKLGEVGRCGNEQTATVEWSCLSSGISYIFKNIFAWYWGQTLCWQNGLEVCTLTSEPSSLG